MTAQPVSDRRTAPHPRRYPEPAAPARLPGVTDVAVDLGSGRLTVTSAAPLDADTVRGAVEEAGYSLAG